MQLTIDNALLKAIEYHKMGNIDEANRFYQSILKVNPKHPDANHNLGLLITNNGDIIQSYHYFKTALEANTQIPQFWFSYIDVLIKLNKNDDAKKYFKKAKEMNFTSGKDFKVLEQKLFELSNENENLSQIQKYDPPKEQMDFIINLYQEKKYIDVQRFIDRLLKKFPNSSQLFHILGASYSEIKKYDQALRYYEEAIFLNSKDEMIWNDIGNTQRELGLLENSLKSFKNAIKLNKKCEIAHNNIANSYRTLGDTKNAIKHYKKAIIINPSVDLFHHNLGQVYLELKKFKLALASFKQSVCLKPNFDNQLNLAELLLRENCDPQKALPILEQALLLKPNDTRTIAYKTIALRGLNKFKEAKNIINFKNLVQPDYIKNHTNHDVDKLNRKILSYLINHPNRIVEKNTEGWAIRGGTAVRNLFSYNDEIINDFENIIRNIIDKKIASLKIDCNHPFLMKKPLNYDLDCWANLLEAGDYQANHIHNNGWMSGVYYVDLPEIENEKNKHAGWIEFNRAGYDLPHFGEEKDIEIIKPEQGMYILFPSYVWHGTIPYVGKENRVSISFDIIPK